MKTQIKVLLGIILTSVPAFAANPGVICVENKTRYIIIEPRKNRIRQYVNSTVVQTMRILKTTSNALNTIPMSIFTSYELDEGHVITTNFEDGQKKGTGAFYRNGKPIVNYAVCAISKDIKR